LHKDLITIGKILKPVGLRGEVKVLPLTDFPDRFKALREVIVQIKEEEKPQQYQIDHVRYGPPFVYITFSGFFSVDQVDVLIGGLIQIPEEQRVLLPEGSYYQFELQDVDVYLEDGTLLGKVNQILQTGSNDVFVVKSDTREYLIPALHTIVKEIDISKKRMMIHPMDGLLEL
jgi:16S rRNA processing protein RimM